MWRPDVLITRNRIALLAGQFIALILCIIYIEYIYFANILPDKRAKENYQQTDCFLIAKQLNSKGKWVTRYRADFLISYNVGGVQYSRWVAGNGLDMSYSSNQAEQTRILAQFVTGEAYPCWYDSNEPERAILVMRHNWLSTFPLLLPSVIGVIVLYYLILNLIQLAGFARMRKRERLEEKKRQQRRNNKLK
jgi:hypothetical protein